MSKIHVGLNAEFSRSSDKPFEWAVQKAAEMGYKYFEPMIHFGRELMSEAGYFHTVSMFDDPWRIKEACDKAGLKISGLQSHGPLGRPDVHGEYIKLAIRVAAEIGVPVINTDEGIKAKWTTEEEDFVLIKYTLQEAAFIAERTEGVHEGQRAVLHRRLSRRIRRPLRGRRDVSLRVGQRRDELAKHLRQPFTPGTRPLRRHEPAHGKRIRSLVRRRRPAAGNLHDACRGRGSRTPLSVQ